MQTIMLLGTALGLGLVSGINLYATVLTVGLCLRLHLLHLHPALAQLAILESPVILVVAGTIYAVEFFADKIPWVDSLWDCVHAFIRPIGAVIVGGTTLGTADPTLKLTAMLLCGGIAFSSHSLKAGTRIAANHSPEPFSNIGLSFLEDGLTGVGSWLSLTHPGLMLAICIVFLIISAFVLPWALRLIQLEFHAAAALLTSLIAKIGRSNAAPPPVIAPVAVVDFWRQQFPGQVPEVVIRCAAGSGVKGLKHSIGYLHVCENECIFITRRTFRIRKHGLQFGSVQHVHLKKGIMMDTVSIMVDGKRRNFHFFKHPHGTADLAATRLDKLALSQSPAPQLGRSAPPHGLIQ